MYLSLCILFVLIDYEENGSANAANKTAQAEKWFEDHKSEIFMPSWLAEYFTVPSIHRPELHEYHEGLTKSTIQVCGDFLNRISPALQQKSEGIMTTSIHKSLRRLRIN